MPCYKMKFLFCFNHLYLLFSFSHSHWVSFLYFFLSSLFFNLSSLPPSLPPPRPPRNIHKSVLSLTSDHKYLKHMKSVSRRTRGWLKWASFYCLPFPLHHSVILRPFSSCEEIHRTLKQCCWPWTAFDGVSAWWNKTQQWLSGLFLFSIYTS